MGQRLNELQSLTALDTEQLSFPVCLTLTHLFQISFSLEGIKYLCHRGSVTPLTVMRDTPI